MQIDKQSATWITVREWARLRLKKARDDLECMTIPHGVEFDAGLRKEINVLEKLLELEKSAK